MDADVREVKEDTEDILPPLTAEEQANELAAATTAANINGDKGSPSVPQESPAQSQSASGKDSEPPKTNISETAEPPLNTGTECTDDSCPLQKIILGEPEKDQLKAVGAHLLQIGKDLLEEMNFVESLLGNFTPFASNGMRSNRNSQDDSGCNSDKRGSVGDKGDLRKEIIESADAVHAQVARLSRIQEITEEYKQAAKAAKFGSAFGSPDVSNSVIKLAAKEEIRKSLELEKKQELEKQESDSTARNQIVALESKVENITSVIKNCENQIADVHTSLRKMIDKVYDEIAQLKSQIAENNVQNANVESVVDDKIRRFEQQMMRLTKTVWELKCETRAQMHFGKEFA